MRAAMLRNAYVSPSPIVDPDADYLRATEFCDVDAPLVRELAAEVTAQARHPAEKAAALFAWVRDRVTYRLGLYPDRASETLARGEGSCSNKANLLVALLRASGIPAGYHCIVVNAQTYIGPLCTWRFGKFFSPRSHHFYTGLRSGAGWIQCDCSDDIDLCSGASHLNPPASLVDFDGSTSAVLNLDPADILEVDGVCRPNIDAVFGKRARTGPPLVFTANAYIDFVRRNGRAHEKVETVHAAFWEWFAEHHPFEHNMFVAAEGAFDARRDLRVREQQMGSRVDREAVSAAGMPPVQRWELAR